MLPGIATFLIALVAEVDVTTAAGLALCAYALQNYLSALGRDLALLQIALLIAAVQWLLGPFLAYTFFPELGRYGMYVSQDTYMSFAVPATYMFAFGLGILNATIDISRLSQLLQSNGKRYQKSALYLLVGGIFAAVAIDYVPSALKFPFFIASQFHFIALIYLLSIRHKYRWLLLVFVFGHAALSSVNSTLFGSLFLWAALVFSVVNAELRIGLAGKYALLVTAVLAFSTIQNVKDRLRQAVWFGASDQNAITVFLDLVTGQSDTDNVASEDQTFQRATIRLNQGWVVSAVLNYVPDGHPHEYGTTIILAVRDSILPRFLFEKREVVASEMFRKYTGLQLYGNTSIGISVLGEAWVNFGQLGILFLFVWGLTLSTVMRLVRSLSSVYPSIALWTPILFLQSVKAETELAVVLNHLTKTGILVILLIWGLRAAFKLRV